MLKIYRRLCTYFSCMILIMGCGQKKKQDDMDGTSAMVQRLEKISEHTDNRLNAYYNDVRVDYLYQLLQEAETNGIPSRESKEYTILKFEYGRQLLLSGQSEAAIQVIEEVINSIDVPSLTLCISTT